MKSCLACMRCEVLQKNDKKQVVPTFLVSFQILQRELMRAPVLYLNIKIVIQLSVDTLFF